MQQLPRAQRSLRIRHAPRMPQQRRHIARPRRPRQPQPRQHRGVHGRQLPHPRHRRLLHRRCHLSRQHARQRIGQQRREGGGGGQRRSAMHRQQRCRLQELDHAAQQASVDVGSVQAGVEGGEAQQLGVEGVVARVWLPCFCLGCQGMQLLAGMCVDTCAATEGTRSTHRRSWAKAAAQSSVAHACSTSSDVAWCVSGRPTHGC